MAQREGNAAAHDVATPKNRCRIIFAATVVVVTDAKASIVARLAADWFGDVPQRGDQGSAGAAAGDIVV